jgi:hypothetical protein
MKGSAAGPGRDRSAGPDDRPEGPDGPVSAGPLALMPSWHAGETGITGLAGRGWMALRPVP